MKNNKGVTLITLVITIIVMVIIATFTIYSALNGNINNANEYQMLNEASTLLQAVENREAMHRLNPDNYNYVGSDSFGSKEVDGKTYKSEDGWYYIDDEQTLRELGVDNQKGSYLVNYKTDEVISITKKSYKNNTYYSLNELKKAIESNNY